MQFSHLEGPESRSPPGGAWWARTPSRSCAGLMEGRELISRLSASVLLLLKVELPESMLVPCPGSMQGVLSHTFFCYTDALFCNETNNCMKHSSPPTVSFGYFTYFVYMDICVNPWNILVSVSPALELLCLLHTCLFLRVEVSELGFSCLHDKRYSD